MKKYFIFAFIAILLSNAFPPETYVSATVNEKALFVPAATPKPKILVRIEKLALDKEEVIIACPPMQIPRSFENPCYDELYYLVNVKTFVTNPKNVSLTFEYKVSGGRITGEGANVVWDLKGVRPGTYMISVAIKGNRGVSDEVRAQQITIRECHHCPIICLCPDLEIKGNKSVRASESTVFTANAEGGTAVEIAYKWTVSQGEIVRGQGTPQIKVKTTPEMTGTIEATIEIDSPLLCSNCPRTTTKTVEIIR